jgi:hypothetical protein
LLQSGCAPGTKPALSNTLVPLEDEVEALTCHAAAYVPSAGLFPRDSFYLTGLNVMQTAHDLLLPSGIHVLINGCVQTGDQISSQFGPFISQGGAKAFCSNSRASWIMV